MPLMVLCFASSSAAAIPLSEYTSAIEFAITDIGSLIDQGGNESEVDYQTRLTTAIGNVRAALPRNQQVQLEKLTWTTDNSWLHRALDDLERASVEERPRSEERRVGKEGRARGCTEAYKEREQRER